jgi:hypothetical protein
MAIQLSLHNDPKWFMSRHYMFVPIERVTEPPSSTVPYRGLITISGVVLLHLRGTTPNDWLRERVSLNLHADVLAAVNGAPYRPRPGHYFSFHVEQGVPFATLNARYNEKEANHDGSAVDTFSLETGSGSDVVLHTDVAVRDNDGWLYRIGYQLQLYVRLEEQVTPT